MKFIVLDIEITDYSQGKFALAEATVAKESEFGTSDRTYSVNTYLGNILKPGKGYGNLDLEMSGNIGDVALGYDLANAILVNRDLDGYVNRGYTIPDVILVKKCYEQARKRRHRKGEARKWRIERLEMEIDDSTKRNNERNEDDEELFLQVPSTSEFNPLIFL